MTHNFFYSEELELFDDKRLEILEIGKKYSIVTKTTSLIVLGINKSNYNVFIYVRNS